MQNKIKVCIAFLGNPFNDSRITNLKNSLEQDGCSVKVISFDWTTPNFKTIIGDISVFKLKKRKFSLLFYLLFASRLKLELFKTKANIYFAEDLYTLPFVTFFAKIHGAKLYYNSRELYAFTGGLRNRNIIQGMLKKLESFFIHKADLVLTTGEMDSEFIHKFYGINNSIVIRNIPLLQPPAQTIDLRKNLGIDESSKILIYQGVLLEGRGLPLIIKSLADLPNAHFVIIGDGFLKTNLEKLANSLGVSKRVHFLGMKKQSELINFTAAGDIGLAIIENISISYYHALPNKLFEYIMAGLPVLSSNLPQMEKIVNQYKIGEAIDPGNSKELNAALNKLLSSPQLLSEYKNNCKTAAQELNWQNEYGKVRTKLLPHLR